MLTSLLLALGLQLVNRIIAKDPSLRLWTLGATANSAGFVLFSMRGLVPDLFSIVVGNTALLTGAVWMYLGNLRFQEVQNEPPWYWFVVAGAVLGMSYFVYVVPSLTTRIVISSAATATILFPSGFVLLSHGDNYNRVVRWAIGASFLASALILCVRATVTPFSAFMGEDFMTVISPVQALPFVLGIVMSLVLGIGLPLLVSGRMQRRLVESEVQLQAILESTADGILAVDRDGKILRANKTFTEMWQIPQSLLDRKEDGVLLNHVLSQLHDPDTFLAKVHALYRSEVDDTDTLRFKDGRVYERHSSALILNHAVLGRVWSFRDVTKRMQA
jgi:PAS domain-containing protein